MNKMKKWWKNRTFIQKKITLYVLYTLIALPVIFYYDPIPESFWSNILTEMVICSLIIAALENILIKK